MIGLRGAVAPDAGLFRARPRARSPASCAPRAWPTCRSASTSSSRRWRRRSQDEGIVVRDGQQVMLDAREVKSIDEIILLNTACAMVDGAYQLHRGAAEARRPRERARRGRHEASCSTSGSEHVDNINAVSRRALQPAPARLLRPDHPARRPGVLRHHPDLHRLQDLLLPDVRRRQGARTRSATRTSRRASGSTPRSS